MTDKIQGIFFKDFANAYIPEQLKEMYRDRVYAKFLDGKKDLTILDIGGNVGVFTFFSYPFAKKIYTVEPSARHTEVIKTMLRFNNMDDKVTLVQKAISDKDGKQTFYHNDNVTMFSLKPEINSRPQDAEEVETCRLDTLFTQYNIDYVDFMKLDVEGSEVDIINSEGFSNVADKIGSMLIEYHQWAGRNPSQIVTTLQDYGFEVFPVPAEASLFGAIKIK